LQQLADLLSKHHIPLLFYITPIDWISGEQFWPGEFRNRITHNSRFIETGLNSGKLKVLDLSQDLAPEFFFWRQADLFPNEHLREKGRIWLAHRLQQAALPLLKQKN